MTSATEPIATLWRRATALHQRGHLAEALVLYQEILRTEPNHLEALNLLGMIAGQRGDLEQALGWIDRALRVDPQNATAHNNKGLVLKGLQHWDAALASFDRAIAVKPNYAEAHSNRGNLLRHLKRYEAAVASYDRAVAARPDYAEAHYNRAVTLADLKQLEEALRSYERAIAIRGNYAEAYSNRGVVLQALNCLAPALASYDRAIALKPDFAEAHSNRGNLLRALKQYEEAWRACDRALKIRKELAEGHMNRGAVLSELRRYEEAIESFDRAIELRGEQSGAHGPRLFAKLQICDWSGWEEEIAGLRSRVESGAVAENPFCVIAAVGSADLQRKSAERWVQEQCAGCSELSTLRAREGEGRLRVGYFSADFRAHPVGHLMSAVFEKHDRARFEVTAFSYGIDTGDEVRGRIARGVERFLDVRARSDAEIVELARGLGIDIAVDLGGYTQDCRPRIFALRAAPLQVSYVGYAGTLGASYMDYLLADETVIPPGSERHYREKVVYLPGSFLPVEAGREVAEGLSRERYGLPEEGVVFCCFNNSYKISPESFAAWMRILSRIDGSVLWLSRGAQETKRNLHAAAERSGVDARRLIFAERVPSIAEHLGRQRLADLFLDTLPYNAHVTTGDALWAGLPVLTCLGESFAGRVAGSLLNALGLGQHLITRSAEEYEERAVELAQDRAQREHIRQLLEHARQSFPLFDTLAHTRSIERAYEKLYERLRAGLPADHLHVI